MRLVECINGEFYPIENGPHPEKGNVYEVDGVKKTPYGPYLHITGFYQTKPVLGRIAYNPDHFREIEFPPQIEAEIKESLERELVHANKI